MKNLFSTTMLFVVLVSFCLMACPKSNSISIERFDAAVSNLENCLNGCDTREQQCRDTYNKSMDDCYNTLLADLSACELVACKTEALNKYLGCRKTCETNYTNCLNEIRACRQECRRKFPLEVKQN